MLRALFLLALLTLAGGARSLASDSGTPEIDFLIVYSGSSPRVGPFNSKSTRADLLKFFPGNQLKDSKIVLGEGGAEQPSTDVLAKGAQATIVWDSPKRARMIGVVLSEPGSKWHTAEGVRIGTTVQELEKLNGGPFQFSGLYWDYGGKIQATGKLSKLGKLGLTLSASHDDAPGAEKFIGDRVTPMSNAPGIDRLGIYVSSIMLFF